MSELKSKTHSTKRLNTLLLSFSLLTSCQTEQKTLVPTPEPSVSASSSVSPTAQPSPLSTLMPTQSPSTPSVSPSIESSIPPDAIEVKSEITGNSLYCQKEKMPKTVALHYPSDIAVTPDGQTVYAINPVCLASIIRSQGIWSLYLYGEGFQAELPEICKQKRFSEIEPRSYLYKLATNQNPEIVTHQGEPVLSCQMGQDLEIDEQQNLYLVDTLNKQVIQYNSSASNMLFHTHQPASVIGFSMPNSEGIWTSKSVFFDYPINLKVKDKKLTYQLQAHGDAESSDGRLFLYDFKSNKSIQISQNSYGNTFPVTIYKNMILALIYRIIDPPTLGLSRFDFTSDTRSPEAPEIPIQMQTKKSILLFDQVSSPNGKIYISDIKNHSIWSIELNNYETGGELNLLAGSGVKGYQDGKGDNASFYAPTSLSVDATGNVFVADTGNHAIRKITPEGVVTTFYKETVPAP